MYNALLVANHIVKYCNSKNHPISNLKLQKLLYFVQAEFLVSKGIPCFREAIEAWDFGPVVPEVYHHFKKYGSSIIISYSRGLKGIIDPVDCRIIENMVDECVGFSATQLVEITCNQDPWKKAYNRYVNRVISKQSIKEFFFL